MNYKILKPKDVGAVAEKLEKYSTLGFDCETGGFDPYTCELRLMQFSPEPDEAYLIDVRDFPSPERNPKLKPLRNILTSDKIEKVGHNLKFDAKFVKHHLGVELDGAFDTFLASRVEACGNGSIRHRLGDAVERFIGLEMDKTEQTSDWTQNELSKRQLDYAARDVTLLHELQQKMLRRLMAKGLVGVSKLENDIVPAMAQVELNGFFLDEGRWRNQLTHVRKQLKIEGAKLQRLLSAGVRQTGLFGPLEIDLASKLEVARAMVELGVPMPRTEKGNLTTDADLLEPLRHAFPSVEQLATYRGLEKQDQSYGENILDLIHPITGRLHADFAQLRAPSGRMGCENPNLQNLPKEYEYRSCFQAPLGKKLIVADFSQIELRVMAHISGDPAMIHAFKSGVDYHTATAMAVFNVANAEDVTVEQRTFAKRVNFGIGYGIGAGKLSRMTGMDFETTEKFLKQFFDALKGLDTWLRRQAYMVVKQKKAKTLSGRTANFHIENIHDRGEVGRVERQGKNVPIQGTAADIFKRALYLMHTGLKDTSGLIVNLVHDEFVVEADEAEAKHIAGIMEESMRQAGAEYIDSVEITADAKIMDEWSK